MLTSNIVKICIKANKSKRSKIYWRSSRMFSYQKITITHTPISRELINRQKKSFVHQSKSIKELFEIISMILKCLSRTLNKYLFCGRNNLELLFCRTATFCLQKYLARLQFNLVWIILKKILSPIIKVFSFYFNTNVEIKLKCGIFLWKFLNK